MNKLITALAATVALAITPAFAQEARPARKLQIAPYVGGFFPTGDQRHLLDDSFLFGLTLSYDVHPYIAVVGSFGWTSSRQHGLEINDDLDVFQQDLGVQGQYAFNLGKGIALKPLVGAGIGARTYHYRDADVDGETDFAGYFALGGTVEYRDVVVGLTVRDYISAFDGIGHEEASSTRNDIAVFASLGARF